MSVALKAGNHLDSVAVGVIVYRLKLVLGVAAAHISKIRATLKLYHVLGVKHCHSVAHKRKSVEESANSLHGGHGATRRVDHHRKLFEEIVLGYRERVALFRVLGKKTEASEKDAL